MEEKTYYFYTEGKTPYAVKLRDDNDAIGNAKLDYLIYMITDEQGLVVWKRETRNLL